MYIKDYLQNTAIDFIMNMFDVVFIWKKHSREVYHLGCKMFLHIVLSSTAKFRMAVALILSPSRREISHGSKLNTKQPAGVLQTTIRKRRKTPCGKYHGGEFSPSPSQDDRYRRRYGKRTTSKFDQLLTNSASRWPGNKTTLTAPERTV